MAVVVYAAVHFKCAHNNSASIWFSGSFVNAVVNETVLLDPLPNYRELIRMK